MASSIFDLADRYVDDFARTDPLGATFAGLSEGADQMTDLSPDGYAERAHRDRQTLRELSQLEVASDLSVVDRRAADVMKERLGVALEEFDTFAWTRDLNTIASPLQAVLEVLDLADTETPQGRRAVVARLEAVPVALSGYQASLAMGLERGEPVALRQVEKAIQQTRDRAAHFAVVADRLSEDSSLAQAAREAGGRAAEAYESLGHWLANVYAPRARLEDGVGEQSYRVAQRVFLGSNPDPRDCYDWGWSRVHELREAMTAVAREIVPDGGLEEALHVVETDSDFAVLGIDAFRGWAQSHVDHMIDELGREQFHLSEAVRRCEVRVSPPGGSTAAHYTGPSEDGSRPGIYWQPDLERERYPLWNQVTTANHEAVPGHHLQIAQMVLGGAELSRYQRLLAWTSGHGEGWALYAERLCHELGLLDRPEAVLGYLAAAQLRAVRVVIDIGVHCGYPLPADAPIHAGQQWTWEIAFDLARLCTGESPSELTSEIDRYFGWPGQAPSYALGEREWLAAREDARRHCESAGRPFDLAAFHAMALDLGSMGLSTMRSTLAQAWTP